MGRGSRQAFRGRGVPMRSIAVQLTDDVRTRLERLATLMGSTCSELGRVAIGELVTRIEGATELPKLECQHPVEVKDSGGRYCGICGAFLQEKR